MAYEDKVSSQLAHEDIDLVHNQHMADLLLNKDHILVDTLTVVLLFALRT